MTDPDLQQFLNYLQFERRYSANTINAYRRDLERFAKHAQRPWTEVKGHDISSHIAGLHGSGLKPRSIQRALSSLRSLFRFLKREGRVAEDPTTGNRAPKTRSRLPGTLDTDQASRLFQFEATTTLEKRDRAMAELLYGSGLRLSELAGTNLEDLDLDAGYVTVRGKGGQSTPGASGQPLRRINTRLADRAEGFNRRRDGPPGRVESAVHRAAGAAHQPADRPAAAEEAWS